MVEADFDTYQANLDYLTDKSIELDVSVHELLEQYVAAGDSRAHEAVSFREELIGGSDRGRAAGLLPTGLFRDLPTNRRVAAILVSFEVATAVELRNLQGRFERYRVEQPLFQKVPTLFDLARDTELIDFAGLKNLGADGVVTASRGFARLDPMLPPSLVQTMSEAYSGMPLYIRLDPQRAWTNRPTQLLFETTLVPANPHWWSSLALRRGDGTGGCYRVDPPEAPTDDLEAYWEYHVKGIRRLETISQRKKEDHLTFMLEELQLVRDDLLIGRCIHLDTAARIGTAPAVAKVLHVDLAINVYVGHKIHDRLAVQMNDAEKVDASFRTHLLRSEGVPFSVAALLSHLFFVSGTLTRELFSNQFQCVQNDECDSISA